MARLTGMFGALACEADGIDRTDGPRIHFASGDIIHMRPSGNAPGLRCYTESDSAKRAEALNGKTLAGRYKSRSSSVFKGLTGLHGGWGISNLLMRSNEISAKLRFIVPVLQNGRMSPAAFPSLGQIVPKI